MNPLVIFIMLVGAFLGYGFARIQLRGRFILAQEAIETAEMETTAVRYRDLRRANELDEWKRHVIHEFRLTQITERCPDGYGAEQILGYNDFGTIHPSLYPGGKEAWLEGN